jgi:hypothetical protein
MTKYPVLFGCDCDPDRLNFSPLSTQKTLSWSGVEKGIPLFREARHRFYNEHGIWIKMTWFVRADYQIKAIHSNAGYCLQNFEDLWRELESEGDEIAWHPHLWDWSSEKKIWFQNIGNEEFTRYCLDIGHQAFVKCWGEAPKTVHTGWCYQDNLSMKILSEYGLIADSSAVPGHNTLGHGLADQADWHRTNGNLYHPSVKDYQRPANSMEKSLNILEVPASVGSSKFAQTLKILRDQVKRRSVNIRISGFDTQVPLMALNKHINKNLINSAITRSFDNNESYFYSYTHCDEFLPKSDKTGIPSWIYSLDNVFLNVLYLNGQIKKNGMLPNFKTLKDFSNSIVL